MSPAVAHVPIQCVRGEDRVELMDDLAVEEPLEIQLDHWGPRGPERRSLSITMRTPGHDEELALGFLWSEGILRDPEDLGTVRAPASPCRGNLVRVALREHVVVDLPRLERHFYTTSSCGVCGKASIQALRTLCAFPPGPESPPWIPAGLLHRLPEKLRAAQKVFETTGGLHASALFDREGRCLVLREDVGRHNALDKVIGRALLDGELPLRERLLVVSGRASFELVQKASMAGLPFLGAVGAPSSLAVDLAREAGMTLVGWMRDGRFSVYTGSWRLT
jgi:FdhD protein